QGPVRLIGSDGTALQFQVLGLSYFDGTNSVLIAGLTNSVGQVSDNQVLYTNALSGIAATIRYTYRKSGLEQDIIVNQQLPDPAFFGLNPNATRLQILTEFFDPPQPGQTEMMLPAQAGVSLVDNNLQFGSMNIGPGRAFLVASNSTGGGALVAKQWTQ